MSSLEENLKIRIVELIENEDGSADLQYVIDAAANIGRYMSAKKIIVDKSTVPVGTADKVKETILKEQVIREKSFPFWLPCNFSHNKSLIN